MQICLSVLLVLLFSCKEKFVPDPVVTFELPAKNTTYNVHDEVSYKIKISSEFTIRSISVYIATKGHYKHSYTDTYNPDTKDILISGSLQITNENLETGTHYIVVVISDGKNSTYHMNPVFINEIPRKLQGWLVGARYNGYTLYLVDETLNSVPVFRSSHNYSFHAVDNKSHLCYIAGETTGDLTAFDYSKRNIAWTIPNNGTEINNKKYFTSLNFYQDRLYVGIYPSSLALYATNGTSAGTLSFEESYYPQNVFSGQYLFVALKGMVQNEYKLQMYYRSHALVQEIKTSSIPERWFELKDGHLLAFYSIPTTAWIANITPDPLWSKPVYSNLGNINDVIRIDNDHYAIAHGNKVSIYSASENTLKTLIQNVDCTALGYDMLSGQFYIAEKGTITICDSSGNNMHTLLFEGEIQFVSPVYNK